MRELISKLQYHYFEQGDFDDIEDRSLEETLVFIRNFPWEEQRNEIFINLNGPSITIENGSGAFIKIGIYYNGKFILYYLNERNQIFCKIVNTLTEFDGDITDFFDKGINESGLNKYRDWLIGKGKYFKTGKFEYRVGLWRMFVVMYLPFISILYLTPLILVRGNFAQFFILILFNLMIFGIHWSLFFNYYLFSRNLYLKVSRGVDEFYFGKAGEARKYSKNDIRTIRTYNNQGYKKPWSEFHTFEIEFRNGEVLKLTNLIIGSSALAFKFPEVIINNKHKTFPFVRKDSFKTIQ